MLDHTKEEIKFIFLFEFSGYLFESFEDFAIDTHDVREDHDTKEHQRNSEESLDASNWIVVSKTDSWQSCENIVVNSLKDRISAWVLETKIGKEVRIDDPIQFSAI